MIVSCSGVWRFFRFLFFWEVKLCESLANVLTLFRSARVSLTRGILKACLRLGCTRESEQLGGRAQATALQSQPNWHYVSQSWEPLIQSRWEEPEMNILGTLPRHGDKKSITIFLRPQSFDFHVLSHLVSLPSFLRLSHSAGLWWTSLCICSVLLFRTLGHNGGWGEKVNSLWYCNIIAIWLQNLNYSKLTQFFSFSLVLCQ